MRTITKAAFPLRTIGLPGGYLEALTGSPGSPEEAAVLPELVGRDREMSLLLACLDAAQRGQGNLVVCVGEPGIGKTRLAEELTRAAQARGVTTAWGRAAATAGAPPYWPWREALQTLPGAGTGQADGVAELVSVTGHEPSLEQRMRRFDAVSQLVQGTARSQPLLLVLDDLDRADEPSRLLAGHVARTARADQLLLVVTCRDTAGALATLAPEPHTTQVQLRGLDRAAVARHVSAIAGRDPSEAELCALDDATAGNPFFVEASPAAARSSDLARPEQPPARARHPHRRHGITVNRPPTDAGHTRLTRDQVVGLVPGGARERMTATREHRSLAQVTGHHERPQRGYSLPTPG